MLDLSRLRERWPDREVHWRESVDSTMYEAQRLASLGCPSGTVVGADEQTAGIGRHGHHWHSEADAGLYFTAILRLPSPAPIVTLMLGVAIQEAIATVTGVRCDLRWPNDLLIGEKKVAGILAQLHEGAVLAGIGINVNHAALPVNIEDVATSLRLVTGHGCRRDDLLLSALESIDQHAALSKEDVLRLFARGSSYVNGRRVTVDGMRGVTSGLDADGFLLLEKENGGRTLILAGGVRPDPA
ncbi:MAG: biotin--[acetyl-CoA-carboxylase] ligase [Bryobacteraceae bacterium]